MPPLDRFAAIFALRECGRGCLLVIFPDVMVFFAGLPTRPPSERLALAVGWILILEELRSISLVFLVTPFDFRLADEAPVHFPASIIRPNNAEIHAFKLY